MKAGRGRRVAVGLGALGVAALAAGGAFDPKFDLNVWDNFEDFTPTTVYAHGLWLQGRIPFLNLHQALGLPIAGNAQSGALYPIYTFSLLFLRLAGLSDGHLPAVAAGIHFFVAISGWWTLARVLLIARPFAAAFAVGVVSSGFYLAGTAIWQHIGAEYAWFPWILYFAIRLLRGQGGAGVAAGFAAAWFLAAMSSHIQQMIYIGLHVVIFALLMARFDPRTRLRSTRVGVALAWMPLLAMPSAAYALFMLAASSRGKALDAKVFLEASLGPEHLAGFLTPFSTGVSPVFGTESSYLIFAGAWVPIGLAIMLWRRPRLAWVPFLCGLLFLDFALGENSLLYRFTHVIPVWSSFRWPFKFSLHFISMFALAAALGLSVGWNRLSRRSRFVAVMAAVGPMVVLAPPANGLGLAMLTSQIAILAAWFSARRFRLLATAAASTCYLVFALAWTYRQPAHRYSESYGGYGADYFGIPDSNRYRLAPLGFEECVQNRCELQKWATLTSATVNGYLALSGTIIGTAPTDFTRVVAANVWGVLNPDFAAYSIASPLLRSLGVRYYLRPSAPLPHLEGVPKIRELLPTRIGNGWTLLEDPEALPVLSIPDRVIPFSGELSTDLYRLAGDRTAVAEGISKLIVTPNSQVESFQWLAGRGVRSDIDNRGREDTFLLVSLYPYPFLRATVDGAPVRLFKTNAVASGLLIPPGRHSAVVEASHWPLTASVAVAAISFLGGLVLLRRPRDKRGQRCLHALPRRMLHLGPPARRNAGQVRIEGPPQRRTRPGHPVGGHGGIKRDEG